MQVTPNAQKQRQRADLATSTHAGEVTTGGQMELAGMARVWSTPPAAITTNTTAPPPYSRLKQGVSSTVRSPTLLYLFHMATNLPDQVRRQVLELRRTYSLREVAEMTALPLGTVKTLCSRSGSFRDNPRHRELFTLPPIKDSASTDLAVPELPPQEVVTGDIEVDAILWLRSVIRTGQAALIEKAMIAADRIKTPLAELEKRYTKHMIAKHPGSFGAALASFGFADLKGLAKSSIEKLSKQQEARARFGDDLFADTPAERFCADALDGLNRGTGWTFNKAEVDTRFAECADLLPHTLGDCLHELVYWDRLYRLRDAVEGVGAGDPSPQASAREDFVFRCLARIRARTKDEAIAVFHFLAKSERQDDDEANDILLNLIG